MRGLQVHRVLAAVGGLDGCAAGEGGHGGNGGTGSGGAGGVSAAVIVKGAPPVNDGSTLTPGTKGAPGPGGTTGSNDGPDRQSIPTLELQ